MENYYYFQESSYEILDHCKEKNPYKTELIIKMEKHYFEIDKMSKDTGLCLEDLQK
ncbi:hypothetical protein ACSVDA_13715 [Cytobacillus sp. Hm23]